MTELRTSSENSTPSEILAEQVKLEAAEIENAPKVPVSQFQPKAVGASGRCGWCGRFVPDLVLVEVAHGQERYKGISCCGARHL